MGLHLRLTFEQRHGGEPWVRHHGPVLHVRFRQRRCAWPSAFSLQTIWALALAMAAMLPGALAAARVAPRDAATLAARRAPLLAELDEVLAVVDHGDLGPFSENERPEYKRALARLWAVVEHWTVEFLATYPAASARAIEADLAMLAARGLELTPSAARPAGSERPIAVVAVEAGFLGGTFFVVAPAQARRAAATWSIGPLAEANFARHNDLGAWAFTVPGYHDGPLGGRVLALPPTRSGRPRFLIDAITHPGMGQDRPAQVGVWEWTGRQAVPELVETYQTTYGAWHVRLEGDLLRIATKEPLEVLFTCGSCGTSDEPKGTWTLRLTPDGVSDLGHVFAEPALKVADDLLARIARGDDASALAAPDVISQLEEWVAEIREARQEERDQREKEPGNDDPYRSVRGMFSYEISGSGAQRVLDLATDEWRLSFTFEKRGGADYVTAVCIP